MIGKAFIVGFLCFLYLSGFGQANSYQTSYASFTAQLPEQTIVRDKLAKDSLYTTLTSFERELIYFLNYVRQYPGIFSERAVKPYLDVYPEFKPVYGEGLVALLEKTEVKGFIYPNASVVKLAKAHVQDISKHDLMSHNSSDGTAMQKRFEREGLICGSECINMLSKGSPLEVLLSLLVDYKVKNFGHRKSLLGEKMKWVGVGMRVSKKGLQYTVIDLGCE